MQVVTVILMILAFAFMVWACVSLILAIVRKVKAKKIKGASSGASESSGEKGE